jgi:hypothetical protein
MLCFDHTLITRQASVGVIGQERSTSIRLESATLFTTGSDCLGWVETVSIPVCDTDSRSRYLWK